MNVCRRRRLGGLLLVLIVLIVGSQPAASQSRPNIVVIMTDDQDDRRSLEVMSKTRKALKTQGVHFTNSFTNFPVCCPSRASLLTGLAAHNHGVLSNNPSRGGGYVKFFPHEDNTLALWLQRAGYITAFMGKYMDYRGVVPRTHVPPGWSEWYGMTIPKYFDYDINENGTLKHYGKDAASYSTDVLTQKAIDFINRLAGTRKPFFLLVTPKAPHTRGRGPAAPARRHIGRFADLALPRGAFNESNVSDKPGFVQAIPRMDAAAIADVTVRFRRARESLLAVDDMVEAVVEALAETQRLRNTVIIFTSDNGYLYGAHRLIGKGVLYEDSIRVPLLMRGPGFPRGEVRRQLVNNLDVAATIVDLTGIAPPHPLDGKSLLPIIRDSSERWRTALLVQGLKGRGRYVAVRTADSIYAEHESEIFGSEREYYDLTVDPRQHRNRADVASYAAKIAALRALLARLKTCAGRSCWVVDDVDAVSATKHDNAKSAVYRGPLPKLYGARRDYDMEQSLDE